MAAREHEAQVPEGRTPGDADTEISLDPEDWDEFRALAHRSVDLLVEYLRSLRERPAWQPLPPDAKNLFREGLPMEGLGPEQVWEEVRRYVLPYPTGNLHPRFWSWVGGTGTPIQLVADMFISAMNSTSLGFDEASSTYVETQVLDWFKTMMGFPSGSSGLLVSGGSMANLVGLAVARTAVAGYDVRDHGADPERHPRLVYYASTETHSSVRKAVELLGLGSRSLRSIPVLDDYSIDVEALRRTIEEDLGAGLRPACVVANAGTVNTGAADPLDALADVAAEHGAWLHVDGAFGAFARLSASGRARVAGIERADSLAFDLHKWLYVQYDCGCVLVRRADMHRDTFSVTPAYLRKLERGLASGPVNFSEYGVQLSRSFKALRPWMALRSEGVGRYARQIEQNLQQARYLTALVEAAPDLELLAPTVLNIVNFRYRPEDMDDEDGLDALNREILMRLHESGVATPSSTELRGRFAIRVAICNHRSLRSDFLRLTEAVRELGRAVRRENGTPRA